MMGSTSASAGHSKASGTGRKTDGKRTAGKKQPCADKLTASATEVSAESPGQGGGADPKSLSWMAAQAVSALNAVKDNQAGKGKVVSGKPSRATPGSGTKAGTRLKGKNKEKARSKDKSSAKPGHKGKVEQPSGNKAKTKPAKAGKSLSGKPQVDRTKPGKRSGGNAAALNVARSTEVAGQTPGDTRLADADRPGVNSVSATPVQMAAERPTLASTATPRRQGRRKLAIFAGIVVLAVLVIAVMPDGEKAETARIPGPDVASETPVVKPAIPAQQWRPSVTTAYPYHDSVTPYRQTLPAGRPAISPGEQRIPAYGYYPNNVPGAPPGYRPGYYRPPIN